jgi:hypothetical protein
LSARSGFSSPEAVARAKVRALVVDGEQGVDGLLVGGAQDGVAREAGVVDEDVKGVAIPALSPRVR